MLPWKDLETLVTEAERILLTTHVRPDGDALGSELAMADLLMQKGKEVEIFNASPTPDRYRFLDPTGSRVHFLGDQHSKPVSKPDLIMVLDTGTWSQLAGFADFVRNSPVPKAVIDHHQTQDMDLKALRVVDVASSACGMLVHQAFEEMKGQLTPISATALFVAIATDTGWMRHSGTTPAVLETLGSLVAAGAKPHEIFQELYETNSIPRMRLLGKMVERIDMRLAGKLAVSYLTLKDIQAAEAHPMDTEDFINTLMSIKGVETALLIIEQKGGGTKASFRSRGPLNCSKLAELFGGGGHKPAAGATTTLSVDQAREKIVAATENAMKMESA